MLKTYYHALWGLSFLAGFAPGILGYRTGTVSSSISRKPSQLFSQPFTTSVRLANN